MNKSEKIAARIWNDLADVPKEDREHIRRQLLEQTDKPATRRFIRVLFYMRERF